MMPPQSVNATLTLTNDASAPFPAPSNPAETGEGTLFGGIRAYVSIARPDHWFKNVFMLCGVLLAYFCYPGVLGWHNIASIVWAVVSTCLLASSNYVLNEILDAPTDLNHPQKRLRPIPSGRVHVGIAYVEW